MGRWHAHAARQAGADVVAAVDVDPLRARTLAQRAGAEPLPSDGWIERVDADVAHICTPLVSHADLAIAALSRGLHVVVEKPLAQTLAETRGVLDAARGAERRVAPVHQFPFQAGVRKLRDAQASLGDPTRIAFTAFTAGGEGRKACGRRDVILEILPHAISLLHVVGYRDLAALKWSMPILTNDDLAATADSGGVELSVRISLRARPITNQFEFAAEHGRALVDLYHGFASITRGGATRRDKLFGPFRAGWGVVAAAGANLVRRVVRNEPAYPGLRELLTAFYRSLGGGDSPIGESEILDAAAYRDVVSAAYSARVGGC
jgi:predicted dehydrogenase